jgi:hypothetical protein
MNLRERLADWISGGALTRAVDDGSFWEETWAKEHAAHTATIAKHAKLTWAINRIAAMETHKANATVKRMAKTAREALGNDQPSSQARPQAQRRATR